MERHEVKMNANERRTTVVKDEHDDSEARRTRVEGSHRLGGFLLSVALLALLLLMIASLWPYVSALLFTFGDYMRRFFSYLNQL